MREYSYKINRYNVTVTMTAANGNDSQPIAYAGDNADRVKSALGGATGAFGHGFNIDSDTPTDLDAALHKTFPGLIERTGAKPNYDPGIPEGALT